MDKETLSNYGWIVICILVLSVMIALATPFGSYIGNAVKSTTQGLFDVQQKAMGVAGLVVEDQAFSENENSSFETPVEPTADNLFGIWEFNETLSWTGKQMNIDVNFTTFISLGHSQQTEFSTLRIVGDYQHDLLYSDEKYNYSAVDNDVWQTIRKVDFGTTGQAVSQDFFDWLVKNATMTTDNSLPEIDATNLLGKWRLNDTISTDGLVIGQEYNINFNYSGVNGPFTYIMLDETKSTGSIYLRFGQRSGSNGSSQAVYYFASNNDYSGWQCDGWNISYQEINITKQPTDETIINWLIANATKIE